MKKFISLICVLSICLFLGFANKVEPVSAEGNPNLHKLILTNNDCYKAGQYITPKGIMVHSTGANNPNLKRYLAPNDGLIGTNTGGNHWNQSKPDGQQKCVHAFIGKLADGTVATYQTLPWNMRGWHCGGAANNTHIGFEMCEDALTDKDYFLKVYNEAVELCAYLCKLYNFNPLADGVIIGHYEGYQRGVASNHADPGHWFSKFGKSMDTLRQDVYNKMNQSDTLYCVQVGAFSVKANADALLTQVKAAGFDGYIKTYGQLYCVQLGAFSVRANAEALLAKAKAAGFDGYIKVE
ncbi:MAG: N-acetylmuramoyl-L-alanine amidase [Prevotella sp.]|nr:N-acetylmuramoyl-L-alanine amidase [Prevotella sp.]